MSVRLSAFEENFSMYIARSVFNLVLQVGKRQNFLRSTRDKLAVQITYPDRRNFELHPRRSLGMYTDKTAGITGCE